MPSTYGRPGTAADRRCGQASSLRRAHVSQDRRRQHQPSNGWAAYARFLKPHQTSSPCHSAWWRWRRWTPSGRPNSSSLVGGALRHRIGDVRGGGARPGGAGLHKKNWPTTYAPRRHVLEVGLSAELWLPLLLQRRPRTIIDPRDGADVNCPRTLRPMTGRQCSRRHDVGHRASSRWRANSRPAPDATIRPTLGNMCPCLFAITLAPLWHRFAHPMASPPKLRGLPAAGCWTYSLRVSGGGGRAQLVLSRLG